MAGIRFTGIGVWRAAFRLRLRFSHHLASRDRVETLIVALTTSRGALGHGQALPRSYLTGESLESALAAIRGRFWPELAGLALPEGGGWAGALEALRPLYLAADAQRLTAAYAALDLAALDAFAAGLGQPLRRPPGGQGGAGGDIPLVGVLPAAGPGAVFWLARLLRFLGYRRFKVKLDRDREGNARRLAAARRAAGSGAWLAADANGAWTREEALAHREILAGCGVGLLEEPLRREEAAAADFAALERELGLPIMADESLCTLADARGLLERGPSSWWNLRLAKIGGFSGWERLSALARENGVNVYGGILVGETSLLAAAARTAWAGGGVVCGEYGFPRLFLAGDPFRGGPGGFGGGLGSESGKNAPGLGIRLDSGRLGAVAELLWRDGDYEEGGSG